MATKRDKQILNSILNPQLPIGEAVYDEDIPEHIRDEEEDTEEVRNSKEVELEGVKCAEVGNFGASIEFFTRAIKIAPWRPSCHNNRAQAYRLNGDVDSAFNDLNEAIRLGEGKKGKTICQAYCQRALIHKLRRRDAKAEEDFRRAANLGSQFAKAQLVQMNPYAAMCNNMLSDVMRKLQEGEVETSE